MKKLYVLLPAWLTAGQSVAQACHAVARLAQYVPDIYSLPVVCLKYKEMEELYQIKQQADLGKGFQTWYEPDYDRACASAAFVWEGKFPYHNQTLGKLKLVE